MTYEVPSGSTVDVIFPGIYQSGLGISLNAVCSVPCVRFDRTVTFDIENTITNYTEIKLTIEKIFNPTIAGGTGNFIIIVKVGE